MKTVKLHVCHLEDRTVPALDVYWLGGTSTDWNTDSNWQGGVKPGTDDTAILGATNGKPPTIAANQTATVANVQMPADCDYDLTIDGTLNTKGSLIQPANPHGYIGSGSLILGNTPGTSADGVWTEVM